MISQIFMDQGYDVLRLRYVECIKGPGRDVPRLIRNGSIVGICIAYHEWKKRIPADVINRYHNEIGIWLKHAQNMEIPVMVIGLTGNHWDQSIWDEAIKNKVLFESKHRLCSLNIKLRNLDAPSNLCLKILSTFVIPSTPCQCGIAFKDHVNDWHPYGDDTDRMNHRDAMIKIYGVLAERRILSLHDDAEHMYPTDERVEWKRKRKENKEKGIEVKKKTKVVEAHFDDCGTDLS